MIPFEDKAGKWTAIGWYVAIRTACAVIGATVVMVCGLWLFIGVKPDVTVPVSRIWFVGLTLAEIGAAVICPLIALPTAQFQFRLRLARDEVAQAARTDPLTGLMNRRGFDEASARRLADHADAHPSVALMCDVDCFKEVNDKYGHEFGDLALTKLAAILKGAVGERDGLISRRGGEEFAILLPSCTADELAAIAEAARAACEAAPFIGEGFHTHMTISIGIGVANDDEEPDLRALLAKADAALYQAKRNGRNRVVGAFAEPPRQAA